MSSPEVSDEVLVRVTSVICEVLALDPNSCSPDSSIREDLGADSLDVVTLVWTLEEEFGGQIEDSEVENLTTPSSIARYISSRLKQQERNE